MLRIQPERMPAANAVGSRWVEFGQRRGIHLEALLLGWERTGTDIGRVLSDGIANASADIGVAAGVLRDELVEHAEQVVKHLHLPVAVHAGTDPDRRNTEPRRQQLRKR